MKPGIPADPPAPAPAATPKLANLLTQLADTPRTAARLSKKDKVSRWLFPCLTPGRPAKSPSPTSSATWASTPEPPATPPSSPSPATCPFPILADVLGLHTNTAERWADLTKSDWTAYIADRADYR
ncbi:hypothetical protein [Amycolatopsis sp. NPDC051371]|uniref:hypothetical protein n=1 Tax=Amycolatopsis sp. NPDC051371 TaxID=3155800 RepID=UPI0034152471